MSIFEIEGSDFANLFDQEILDLIMASPIIMTVGTINCSQKWEVKVVWWIKRSVHNFFKQFQVIQVSQREKG